MCALRQPHSDQNREKLARSSVAVSGRKSAHDSPRKNESPDMPKTGLLLLLLILALSSAHADEDYTIAIIGTGNMASALGPNLAQAGHTVVYGSRDPDRESVAELIARTGENASATTQAEAAVQADIVILAVPWFAVERLIPALGNRLLPAGHLS